MMNDKDPQSDYVEIDLLHYWNVLKKRRRFIGIFVAAAVFLMLVASLFMTNIFGANAIIVPVQKDSRAGGLTASLFQQMGSLPGISLPETASQAEIVTLLKSDILREKIITQYNLLPVLFPDRWDEETKGWKKRGFSLNPISWAVKLVRLIVPSDMPQKETLEPELWDGLRALNQIARITSNVKDRTITISVQFKDPEMTAMIANYYLSALNDHMSSEAKRVALINRTYLEQQLAQTPDPFIKQKIYNMIAQQIETSMMAEVKENFAFKVLDPPRVPDRKIKPKRAQIVVISFLFSLMLGVFIALFRENLERRKA
jgi:uncharacterized protein involved in exopolysaccharide biosynthesis